jgi:hypothetical protein
LLWCLFIAAAAQKINTKTIFGQVLNVPIRQANSTAPGIKIKGAQIFRERF